MRKISILICFLFLSAMLSAAESHMTTISQIEINELKNENQLLRVEIENIKSRSETSADLIYKMDAMYNNNYNRLYILYGSLGSLFSLIIALLTFFYPRWMKREQNRIIQAKKVDLQNSNDEKIKAVLEEYNAKINESESKFHEKLNTETERLNNVFESKILSFETQIKELITSSSSMIYGRILLSENDYTGAYNIFISLVGQEYEEEKILDFFNKKQMLFLGLYDDMEKGAAILLTEESINILKRINKAYREECQLKELKPNDIIDKILNHK